MVVDYLVNYRVRVTATSEAIISPSSKKLQIIEFWRFTGYVLYAVHLHP